MFSIVIPLYNKAKNIEKTLTSLLNQSFTEFEIVIVNDGSTDDGVDVINRFTNDKRINIIHQENKGASAARNKGVSAAKYNYVAFID
jgi:glycosyltransferase involved in cell wall biosynthesis